MVPWPLFLRRVALLIGVVVVTVGGLAYVAGGATTDTLGVIGGIWAMVQVFTGLLRWIFPRS